ncbi:hypothetical protein D3C78_834340 [compost metagenome]
MAAGIEDRATEDGLFDVRVADEPFHLPGFRVGLGVIACDFLGAVHQGSRSWIGRVQEGADSSVQGTRVVEGGDAHVAGIVDSPTPGCGDHVHLGAVGMAYGVHAGGGNACADADAGEVVLFAIDDHSLTGHRFHGGDVLLDTPVPVADAAVSGEPEAFTREVVGEDDGLQGIESALRGNGAHEAGGGCSARRA